MYESKLHSDVAAVSLNIAVTNWLGKAELM
jgi:hypothetical protein